LLIVMLPITIAAAVLLAGLAFWALLRRARRSAGVDHAVRDHRDVASATAPEAARILEQAGSPSAAGSFDIGKIAAANAALTQRLWRMAFVAPLESEPLPAADLKVRDQVLAVLNGARLDAKFFPRRPTLMPQLMQAVQDPAAATERLSRIVAHDPVLAADVLRLANSSRFRTSALPIETIQRAIVVMGVDALRGLLAVAMMQPVFRASRNNFPRFPRMLWERTERAARAANAFALRVRPEDRFESQLAILLSALGPLAVYGAALEIYARNPEQPPSAALLVELTSNSGRQMALHIARQWETSARLQAAIEQSPQEPMALALSVGELLGTLSMLEAQHVITADEAAEIANSVSLGSELLERSARAA
jgi:HD-like signal output (HDOD) protein